MATTKKFARTKRATKRATRDTVRRSEKPVDTGGRPGKAKGKGGTIVISDDFIGLKDEDGHVLIDDTAYFRIYEREAPVRDALRANEVLEGFRNQFSAAVLSLGSDEKARQEVHWTQHRIEEAMISTFATLLQQVRDGK